MEFTYSSTEVLSLAGVTYRQLVHWVGTGLVEGQGETGSGYQRRWTPEQVQRVIEIRETLEEARALLEAKGLGHFLKLSRLSLSRIA